MKKFLVFLAVTALSLAALSACGKDEGKTSDSGISAGESSSSVGEDGLIGFDVPETGSVSYGQSYTLPVFVVTDTEGNVYSVTYSVTNGGEAVTVVAGKFDVEKTADYIVVYSVEVGGKTISKTMTLKVIDDVRPTVRAEGMKAWYFIGEDITLPEITVTDNLDTEPTYKLILKQGDTVKKENVTEAFKLTETGKYTLEVSVEDSSGNKASAFLNFVVRAAANRGEIEDFSDELAVDCVNAWNDSDESFTEKGYGEIAGRKAAWFRSADEKGNAVKYPGINLVPRITKAEAQALKEERFTFIAVDYYIDYENTRTIYQKWSAQQQSYAAKSGEWATVKLPLDTFIENYDAIAGGGKSFLYIGNDPLYTSDKLCADFKFYVSSIYVTKTIDDIAFTDNGLENKANLGDELTVANIAAASASVTDAEFSYTYYAPDGAKIQPKDGKFTFSDFGVYKVEAAPVEKCYAGSAVYEIVVKATAENVNALIEEILSAPDIGAMAEKASKLKAYYATLSEDEKGEVDAFRYIKAVTLLTEKPNELFYFDTVSGREQISLEYNIPTAEGYVPITTKNGITFTTAEKYGGEAGATKITFEDAPVEWLMPYTVRLSVPSSAKLSDYGFIKFYIKSYSWNANRPLCYNIAVNGKRIAETANPVTLTTGEWTEVIIPLSYITGNVSEVTVNFSSLNNNSAWSSVWNDPTRMYVYFSGMYLGSYADDIEISSDFAAEELYSVGDTVDLSKFVASSQKYPDAVYKYYVVAPDGASSPLGASLKLETSGEYTLVAEIVGEELVKGKKEIKLVAKKTADEVLEMLEAVKAATDKTTAEYAALVAETKRNFELLDASDKAQIGEFTFYAAVNGVTEETNNKLYYFDTAMGPDEVKNAYNKDVALTSKAGIAFDPSVAYGEEKGSLKVTFSDVPSEWFGPYILTLTLPASSDLTNYEYIVFYMKSYVWSAGRPMTYTLKCDGKYINGTNNTILLETGVWQKVMIPVSEITDISKLTISFYTKNNGDAWGSLWNQAEKIGVNISAVYGIKAVNDLAFDAEFAAEGTYDLNSELSLEKMTAYSAALSKSASKYYLVTPSGVYREITSNDGKLLLEEEGAYTFIAIYDLDGYYGEVEKNIEVADPDDGHIYLAKNNSSLNAIVPVGYGSDKVGAAHLEEFEGVKNVVKASTAVKDGANENAYRWPGFTVNSRLTAEELTAYKQLGYTKVIVPLYAAGSKKQAIAYGADNAVFATIDPNKWNYLEVDIDKFISADSLSFPYFIYLYNKDKGEPTAPEKDLVYYIGSMYLAKEDTAEAFSFNENTLGSVFVTTDWKSVDAAAYALSASDAYGEEGNCLKIVAPENSGLVFGVSLNKAFDLKGYDKIYLRVKTNGAKTGYAFYTEHANVYTSRVIDLRADYFTPGEWTYIEIPAALVKDFGTLTLLFINNGWNSPFEAGTEFYVSSVYATNLEEVSFITSDSSFVKPAGTGTDKVAVSDLEEFAGRKNVRKVSTTPADGASTNAWKWPGVKITSKYSAEALKTLKAAGYTKIIVPLYVDGKNPQTVRMGKAPYEKVMTLMPEVWTDVEISIDTLIAEYDTYLGTKASLYLIYLDNEIYKSAAEYINYYIGDVTLA